MRYVSTRGNAPVLGFSDVVLAGLARDGGLYVPETWPTLDAATIASFAGRSYPDVAFEVISRFVDGDIADADLKAMIDAAYTGTFRHPAVTPLVQIAPDHFLLELFHGPTLAFKDVAMQLLARLMDHVLGRRGARATIVGATSGDTGGAAIEAFRGRDNTDIFILFPDGRVSDVQRRQMTTVLDANVHCIALQGTFDDAQGLVKGMFNHFAFRDELRLSGVNSINWGRIAAQVVYYFVAAVALGAPARKVSFTVPTGNFGDIFAGYVAKKMGLPIDRLVIATNVNDILARTLETGRYEATGVVPSTSPSMDIEVSSNFERLVFEACGRDAPTVTRLMQTLTQSGAFALPDAAFAAIRSEFAAGRASVEATAALIRRLRSEAGYLIDTHGGNGVVVAEAFTGGPVPMVTLATAHPAKFPDAVQAASGERPALPAFLGDLMERPERMTVLANDLAAVEAFVRRRARVLA
ncbi:threonine synthase [Pleomorphomonas carboxyditropha]|uniref:Threonine synthase n=1 Tax=Pleomorphomonas carboxyditropha TaxID=2023338 RepID=A0A2G9WZQ0_9HYPH|nr:threonine synthase [Pleomorphomonas carboxyditropha]PIO99570.1 threonine synthase [Pleomorphomonas carboxyditropha]